LSRYCATAWPIPSVRCAIDDCPLFFCALGLPALPAAIPRDSSDCRRQSRSIPAALFYYAGPWKRQYDTESSGHRLHTCARSLVPQVDSYVFPAQPVEVRGQTLVRWRRHYFRQDSPSRSLPSTRDTSNAGWSPPGIRTRLGRFGTSKRFVSR